jgi:hypothetical protein
MDISDVLYKTFIFSTTNGFEFQYSRAGHEKNGFNIDEDQRIVTLTIIDVEDKDLPNMIEECYSQLQKCLK